MDVFTERKFRYKNVREWLLLCVALLTLGGMLASWYAVESARVTAAENERLHALSKILVKDVGVNLVAVNNALSGIIRDRLGAAAPVDRNAVDARLGALIEAMPGVRGIMVLDAGGTVIAAVPTDMVGRNFAQRSYFTEPRRRGDATMLYLTPPFQSVRNDIIISASRIVPGNGRFNGVVTAVLNPGYFSGILQTSLYAPDLGAALVHDSRGVFVAVGRQLPERVPSERLDASATAIPASLHTDSKLGLVLQRDLAMVQAPLQHQARAFAAAGVVLTLMSAIALAWFQGRRARFRQSDEERDSERAHAEAISASEARFRTLIEEAPVAVAMARHGRFIYTNRRYNLLHGHAEHADLTGRPWHRMIAPASLRDLQEQQAVLDADAAVEQRFEAIGLGRDASEIPVFKATSRVVLGDGPATLIFVHDITPQKTAENNLLEARDAAQAANRSKADFLANMSHEIRTPLNAILGMAYLLERSNRDAEAVAMLQKIRVSGRSLLGIVNDILDVSKIEADAMTIERSWFQLQDVIDAVAATMGVAVGNKPIALVVQPLPASAACVLGDALRIEQLLVNLTSNAIKFTESGRIEMRVDAQPVADGVIDLLFRVSDTGIGIAPDQQDSVFSPFTQADTSTTRRFGGTGLGLTICRQLVALMGGRIGVDSQPGAGSTFWFSLQLEARPAAIVISSPEMVDPDVLIAGADTPARAVLCDTARALGWQVHTADAGAQVLAHLRDPQRTSKPGVVILDWLLADDGCQAVARALRADSAADATAIVIVATAYQAAARGGEQPHDLADALLTTPVTASTLYNAVLEARRHRANRSDVMLQKTPARQLLQGIHILVVDDSGINRDVAERILLGEGAHVVLAENGRSAVDWLVAHPHAVDLVLMDVQMPVLDGIEATRILRAMPPFAQLPIVALTAGAFSTHQDAARSAGMNHFIAKPFDIPLTIDLIRRLVAGGPGAGIRPERTHTAAPPVSSDPLDLRRGIAIWGSREHYQRYLDKFAAAYGDVVARMRRDLDEGKIDAMRALAHKLAGAADNVALPVVSALARRLDTDTAMSGTQSPLLDALGLAVGVALEAIAAGASGPAPAPGPAAYGAPPAPGLAGLPLAQLIERMHAALDEGMPEPAVDVLEALAASVPPALLAPIAACIDDFDWPGAASHLAAVAAYDRTTSRDRPCH